MEGRASAVMTQQLVCEGPCNPYRPAVDTTVQHYRAQHFCIEDGKVKAVPPDVASQLKLLKHTPHYVRTSELAECATCGHHRRHGRVS